MDCMDQQPHYAYEQRPLTSNERGIIQSMPNGVRYCIARGITMRRITNENGVTFRYVVKKSYWVNNQGIAIEESHLNEYRDYMTCSKQCEQNETHHVEL